MRATCVGLLLLGTVLSASQQPPQLLDANQRGQAKRMLSTIEAAIRDTYYDPKFRGLDLDAHFKAAAGKIDQARSNAHAWGIIAQTLVDFNDSHTYFVPPARPSTVEYGWEMRMVGDACYVTAVKPGSDADAKGLKAGDQILQVDQFTPARLDLWKLRYLLYTLSPRPLVKMILRSPDGASRTIEVAAKVTPKPRVVEINIDDIDGLMRDESREARAARNRFGHAGDIAVWKLSGFDFDPADVDRVLDVAVKGASGLVLDMRGNGGGLMKTFQQLTGRLFDRDVKVGDLKGRKSTKPLVAKQRKTPFTGKLVVLVDADSGSAAEILARVIQIEKRGVVIGDRSAGAVMQGQMMASAIETSQGIIMYYASVTNADLIMIDGASLEKIGVTPDEILLPTAADMQAGRDPVLARAVALLGGSLDPLAAGAMFPVVWK